MRLSIIITCLNDYTELLATIKSINETSTTAPEIIVVDDASSVPVDHNGLGANVRLIRNEDRCGVGPSRHIGALAATCPWLLIIDSHMRFVPGWQELFEDRVVDVEPRTLYCCTCLGLDRENMDPLKPKSKYYGATLNIAGRDPYNPSQTQVLEAVWLKKEPEDDADIPCVMGACYFIRREWFLKLGALRYLRSWGMDEVMLSLKCWLAGGRVRLIKSFGIGHRFLLTTSKERQMYTVRQGHPTYNKLFAIKTLLSDSLGQQLINTLQGSLPAAEFARGRTMLYEDWHLVAQERAYNEALELFPFQWFVDRFAIALPPAQ